MTTQAMPLALSGSDTYAAYLFASPPRCGSGFRFMA